MLVARGVRNKVLYREARREVQTLILLYTIFDKKGTPFTHPVKREWVHSLLTQFRT